MISKRFKKIIFLLGLVSLLIPWNSVHSYATSLLLSDDFSTDKGWIDESGGHIYRDASNEHLVWDVTRSDTRRYYIPIDAKADSIQLDFRFNVTGSGGNGMVWIGLAETLDFPGYAWPGADATGTFVGLGRDRGYWPNQWIALLEKYEDGTMFLGNRLNYGSLNTWRRFSLAIDSGNYTMTVWDDNNNQLDQLSGSLSGTHDAYRYFMVLFDETGGWESEQGFLDDIQITGSPLTLEADIDIKPDSDTNSINPKNKGVIPVAILTTEDFDATTVDPLSVIFGVGNATESHNRGHIEDVDNDGDLDLLLHFRTQATGIQCGDTYVSLRGETFGGQSIEGTDFITTKGCK